MGVWGLSVCVWGGGTGHKEFVFVSVGPLRGSLDSRG